MEDQTTSNGSSQPESTPTAPTPAVAVAPMAAKKSKKGLFAAVLGLVVLLGGGSAAAYYTVVLPNKPENVLKQMTVNLFDKSKVTSAHFTGELTATPKDSDSTTPVMISFDGSSKDQALELNATVDAIVARPKLSLKIPDSKTMYLKVSGLDGLDSLLSASPDMEAIAPLITKVNDQWYEISSSVLKSIPGFDASKVDTSALSLSAEDMKKLGDEYAKHPFIKNVEKMANEKVNGKDAFHMKVAFDKDNVVAFIDGVKALKLKALESAKDSDFDELKTAVKKYDWTQYPMEVWVDKATKTFTQIKYSHDYKNAKIDFKFTLKDMNSADIKVEKPTDSKPILDLMGDFLNLYQGASGASGSVDDLTQIDPTLLEGLLHSQ